MPKCLLLSCVVLIWLGSAAQSKAPVYAKRCPVNTINYEQGLQDNLITGVITDAQGFTWISTSGGLQRYNGYTVLPVTPIADGDTIPIDYPVFFLEGAGHSILIGYKQGILEYNPGANSFRKLILTSQGAGNQHSLMPLKQTPEGIWCFEETKGIELYKGHLSTVVYPADSANTLRLIRTEDYSITRKFVATNQRYIFIRIAPNLILDIDTYTRQSKKIEFPGPTITGLECNNHRLFISANDGLAYMTIPDSRISRKFPFNFITDDQNVTRSSIELSTDGRLLVSVEARLFEFDSSCECQKEIIALNRDPLLKTGYIQIVYEDKLRRIWLLTNQDIKRIQNVETPFAHLVYPETKSHFVRSMYYDDKEKVLIAAPYFGAIELYDSSGRPLWPAPLMTPQATNAVAIEKVRDHGYLFITVNHGWFILDTRTKKLQPIDPGNDTAIRNNSYFNNLQRIDDSTLFFITKSNIFDCRVRKNALKVVRPLLPDSKDYTLTCFLYTAGKTLWAATQSGWILRLDPGGVSHRIAIPDNYIRTIAEDSHHRIWVGSESGLYIYDSTGRLLNHLTKRSGLLNEIIYALLPADDGHEGFFASTNFGLSFISADWDIRNYPRELGLQEAEFNTLSCTRSTTGKLFFGGINGITAFYPSELSMARDSSKIDLVRFAVNDSVFNSYSGAWKTDTVRLAYWQNHLEFDLAATGLLNPNEYRYSYRLRGFDQIPQTTTQPTGIRYVLQPGSYTLEVSCKPVLYSALLPQRKFLIIINPPWWHTWWFITLSAIAAILLIFGISYAINHQRYRLRLRRMEIEQQLVTQRERISRELHDNIGTQLSYISNSIDWLLETPDAFEKNEEKSRLSAVNDTARHLVVDLRETIWAMKKESIMLDEFADKLKLYLQSQAMLRPRMETEITENIRQRYCFSPTEALNIFRICQEAIANSIRHAQAGKISLTITSGADVEFAFTIEDNGRGFIPQAHYQGHYGLENMSHRATECGATLSIESHPDKGTRVTISK
ncbi:MAG: hypothetical protein BGO55_27565 [Sphingobacteriales bacterium 50-39]|nr:hypothetical protein [Sphingobacteriales bacterium]OJW56804.1 MAG: hypothetical protein BGO55_27565 [Sphingobacteriales bacterium 50-39]